jgi:hypothetical protein
MGFAEFLHSRGYYLLNVDNLTEKSGKHVFDRLLGPPVVGAVDEHDGVFSSMLGAEKLINHKCRHHSLASTRHTRTEQGRLFRLHPFLVPWALQEPLSSVGLSSVDVVAMLNGVISGANPFQNLSLTLDSGVVMESDRLVLDDSSGVHDRTGGHLQVGETIVDLV